MDLFNLAASLSLNIDDYRKGIDAARAEFHKLLTDIEQAAKNVEKVTQKAQDRIVDEFEKTSEEIRNDTEKAEKETQKSYEKMASNASAAFGKIKIAIAAVAAAATAVTVKLVKGAVSAYGEYEQLVGGVETLFKSASDKVIKNAENAFNTAQMSGRQYLQTLTSFSASLLQGIAAADSKARQMSVEEMSEMLEQQLTEKQEYFDKQYAAAEKSYDKSYDALEKSLDAEIEAVEKAADKKIAAINKEYTEKLKLVDEEKYNRLKAIDAQIDAINDQAEAERQAKEQSEYEAKKAELLDTIQNSQKRKRREEAQKDLEQLEADYAQKQTDRQRKNQIEELKSEKEKVKEQYDSKKAALKEQQLAEVNAVKESEKEQLKAMREAKSEQLKALKESNSEKLKELKKQYSEELKLAKKAAQEQLAAYEEGGGVGDYTEEQYQKAAEIGNRAVIDMADNANKLGTSMESIMAAYQGFSKSNYTMLDNLRLGYGGTKTEMQRLVKDASQMIDIQKELGVTVDASSLSFDNIVNAISVMQKKLDIAGTSAKEAAETVQGSIGRMGAAWDNFIVGLGNKEADIGKLTKDFITTLVGGVDEAGNQVKGVIQNVMPVVENLLNALPDVLLAIGKAIAEQLPTLTQTLLPSFASAVTNLLLEITRLLPTLLPAILNAIKQVVTEIGQQLPEILKLIVEFIETDASSITESVIDIALKLIEVLTEPDVLSALIEAGVTMLIALQEGLWKAIPKVVEALPKIIDNLIKALLNSIPKLIEAGIKLFVSLVQNLPAIISGIIQAVPKIMLSIVSAFNPFGEQMGKIFSSAWEGIKQIFSLDKVGGFFRGVWDGIKNAFSYVTDWFKNIFSEAWENIKNVFSATGETFSRIGRSILNGISTVINSIINGINQVIRVPFDGLNGILRAIKNVNIAGLKPFDWIGQIPVPQIPSIPMLAEGGVLKRGQIALLEGQGDEAVIPLSQNLEWIDNVADRLSNKLGTSATYNILRTIKNVNIAGLKPFDWIGQIPVPQIPSIPMLADGGVLKRGQIALLEGQGDEAVIPLSQNLEWIDNVANRLSNKLDTSATYNFTIHIANMNANDQSEIEQLAERLMDAMAEKTARRRNAF